MIVSQNVEEAFDKNLNPFMLTTLSKLGTEWNFFN